MYQQKKTRRMGLENKMDYDNIFYFCEYQRGLWGFTKPHSGFYRVDSTKSREGLTVSR